MQLYKNAVFQETEKFASEANAQQQRGVRKVHFISLSQQAHFQEHCIN